MDWIKEIFKNGGIEIKDETVFDTIKAEIGKRYADKKDFDDREKQIADIGKKVAEYEKKVSEYEKKAAEDGKEKGKPDEKTYSDTDIENIKKEYEDKINDLKFSSALDLEIQKSGAKSAKALKALLDMEKIGFEDGSLTGFDEQLEEVKKENGYLFDLGLDTGLKHDGSDISSGVEQAFYNINPDLKNN